MSSMVYMLIFPEPPGGEGVCTEENRRRKEVGLSRGKGKVVLFGDICGR